MRQLQKGKEQNRGAAMILAICVLAVVTVLCLSLLLISGVALSNAQKKLAKEQARILAVSYSEEIQRQIEKTKCPDDLEEVQASGDYAPDEIGIGEYIWYNVNTSKWPYYNEDETGHTKEFAYRTFRPNIVTPPIDSWYAGVLGSLEVTMYWTSGTGEELGDSKVYIIVTADRNNQSSTITSVYELSQGQWMMEGDRE